MTVVYFYLAMHRQFKLTLRGWKRLFVCLFFVLPAKGDAKRYVRNVEFALTKG